MKLTFLWLLCKRLFKKPGFLLLLCLIPTLVWGYAQAARQDSGIVTVALSWEDAAGLSIIEDLEADTRLIRFVRCQSPEEARQKVVTGKADAAWSFPDGLEEKLKTYLQTRQPVVQVVQREDTAALRLSREALSARLYCACSQRVYLDYIRTQVPALSGLSDEALLTHYESQNIAADLFAFRQLDGPEAHYLTAPVRGLLAVVLLLCALALAMYACRDDEKGTFGRLSPGKKLVAELYGQAVGMLSAGVAAYLALALSGLARPAEIPALALYLAVCALEAMALKRLLGSAKGLALVLPTAVVLCLTVCPVFFDLAAVRPLQLLLPPTGYLLGVYDPIWLLSLAAHGLLATAFLLWRKRPVS